MSMFDQLLSIFIWYAAVQLFALSITPLLAGLLPHLPDRGYGLAKPLGIAAIGFSTWLFAICTGAEANSTLVLLMATLWFAAGRWCKSRASGCKAASPTNYVLATELLFGISFLGFLLIKAYQPEIFWGEKPMDFTFLNFLTRNSQLPAQDPWAAGLNMKYYYLGTFLFACIHKLTGISSAIGYNLSLAMIPAFSFCVLSTFFRCLGLNWCYLLAGCIFYQFASTWEGLRLLFNGYSINFDQFWATTRILRPAMATEYPLWSFLFGDLHAHVIAVPYVLSSITLICSLLIRTATPLAYVTTGVLLGGILGALISINTWDVLTTGLIAACGAIFIFSTKPKERGRIAAAIIFCAVITVLLALPFLKGGAGQSSGKGFEINAFTTTGELFRCLGMFLIPSWILTFYFMQSSSKKKSESSLSRTPTATVIFLLAATPALCMFYKEGWHSQALPGLLVGFFLALAGFNLVTRLEDNSLRAAGFLMTASGILISFFEVLWLNDRMNTLFKVYYAVWSCLSLATFLLVAKTSQGFLFEWRKTKCVKSTVQRNPKLAAVYGISLLVLAPALFTSITNVCVMMSFQRTPGPRPVLDGLAYLRQNDPNEYQLATFIQQNIRGTPVILEAQGQSYDLFTRVASRTGLPTVLGWDYHVMQRGTPQMEIDRRKESIKAMYASRNLQEVGRLLKQYHVRYVVVGEKEKSVYPAEGLAKFSQTPDLFRPIFSSDTTTLFEVL